MIRELAFVASVLFGSIAASPIAAAEEQYTIDNMFQWSKKTIDVLIVPPTHGQLPPCPPLSSGWPQCLTGAVYTKAFLDATNNWVWSLGRFVEENPAYAWLSQLTINVRVAQYGQFAPGDTANAEIVLASPETYGTTLIMGASIGPVFFLGIPYGPCYALPAVAGIGNGAFSWNYADAYNLAAYHVGACLGLKMIANRPPFHDAMTYPYGHPTGSSATDLHCPSNLDGLGLASAFERAITGAGGGWTGVMPASGYKQYCMPGIGS